MSEKKGRTGTKVLIYLLLVVWAVVVLFPFYWMVLTSVKKTSAYNNENVPQIITADPTLENYGKAFTEVDLGRYFVNTLIFTVSTTMLMMLVTVPASFAFARLKFRGKDLTFALFLSLMMIPTELVIITNYVTVVNLELNRCARTFLGLILPSVTVGLGLAALLTRTTRSAMLDVLRQDYMTTAKAKGASRNRVIYNHGLRNAIIPIITAIGMQFSYVMTGSALAETVFGWPGIGRLVVDSINKRDTPMVTGSIILCCVLMAVINLAVDIIYAFCDPRIKAQYSGKG